MGGKRILTDEQIDMACEMRERGLSCQRISMRFAAMGVRVSAGSISWACLSRGADLPPDRRGHTQGPRDGRAYERNGYIVRTYSPEDDARLLALEARGLTDTAIGHEMGRKPNSIRGRIATLARHQARAEEAA